MSLVGKKKDKLILRKWMLSLCDKKKKRFMLLDLKQHEGTISYKGNQLQKLYYIDNVGKSFSPTIDNI